MGTEKHQLTITDGPAALTVLGQESVWKLVHLNK